MSQFSDRHCASTQNQHSCTDPPPSSANTMTERAQLHRTRIPHQPTLDNGLILAVLEVSRVRAWRVLGLILEVLE
eukprot:3191624-Rhodomonas_salina.1